MSRRDIEINASATKFYTDIPVFDDCSKIVDESTKAIEGGKYKSANMAGAAAISAVINALGHQNFPFVFGGDGVSFAVPA